jgi:hypothetical protein
MKIAILSFDVEEFDMPFEYGGNPPMEEQIATSNQGLRNRHARTDKIVKSKARNCFA